MRGLSIVVSARVSERRQALVAAAFAAIAENGFEGLRLRDVAGRAGIDHSTLHHHFATKQDLVGAVVAHATHMFWPTMPTSGTPASRLHGHLQNLSVMMRERPELFVVLGELDLRARRDAAIQAIIAEHEAGWRTALGDLWDSGEGAGNWRPGLDRATAVELVIAAVKGIALIPDRAAGALPRLAGLLAEEDAAPAAGTAGIRRAE